MNLGAEVETNYCSTLRERPFILSMTALSARGPSFSCST